jgi:hypothetical protein
MIDLRVHALKYNVLKSNLVTLYIQEQFSSFHLRYILGNVHGLPGQTL